MKKHIPLISAVAAAIAGVFSKTPPPSSTGSLFRRTPAGSPPPRRPQRYNRRATQLLWRYTELTTWRWGRENHGTRPGHRWGRKNRAWLGGDNPKHKASRGGNVPNPNLSLAA